MRLLFPTLPAELRNEVYHYTSEPEGNLATTTGVPFKTKTYDFCHTKVIICPVHHGNLSLLALKESGYQEGKEYLDFLLYRGIHLRISIVFTGHIARFVQKHWDEKMSASMRKLIKKYPWIANAASWDIRIVYDEKIGDMDPRTMARQGGKPAAIANGMAATLLGFRNEEPRAQRADVRIQFHIPWMVAASKTAYRMELGLEVFVSAKAADGAAEEIREVTFAPTVDVSQKKMVTSQLYTIIPPPQRLFLQVGESEVRWNEEISQAALVMRRVIRGETSWREAPKADEKLSPLIDALRNELRWDEVVKVL